MIEFLAGAKTGSLAAPQPPEHRTMQKPATINEEDWKYAEQSMKWFGWGSPVGLGLFFISLGGFIVLLHNAGLWH